MSLFERLKSVNFFVVFQQTPSDDAADSTVCFLLASGFPPSDRLVFQDYNVRPHEAGLSTSVGLAIFRGSDLCWSSAAAKQCSFGMGESAIFCFGPGGGGPLLSPI